MQMASIKILRSQVYNLQEATKYFEEGAQGIKHIKLIKTKLKKNTTR